MDQKQAKPKSKILKYLPKATSAVSFQNPPFSPGRHYHHHKRSDYNVINKFKSHAGKGFSGPIVSMIPDEARIRKPKNERDFEIITQEPTSPKVSCMGQIKHKKKIAVKKITKHDQDLTKNQPILSSPSPPVEKKKKQGSKIKRMFSISRNKGKKTETKSDSKIIGSSADRDKGVPVLSDHRAPCLSQMKRFASGRDSFASFDWTAQIAPEEFDQQNYYSDEERGGGGEEDDDDDDDDDDQDIIIPFSAPMTIGGGAALQPRKEVNLWRRRTMNPPRALQLNSVVSEN